MTFWNPWHGCTKISPGCRNCYVYRRDAEFGRDSSVVTKNSTFSLPLARTRSGAYKLQPDGGWVYTCFSSDFFHPDADGWRPEAWSMMRRRKDLNFFIVTKRPDRFFAGLPLDWGDGWENVHLCCTCENQEQTDRRMPVFLELPLRRRSIIHEPMLEAIDIQPWLAKARGRIGGVSCGGESGPDARLCDYAWILDTRRQCMANGVPFTFRQTGALFRKDGRIYRIDRRLQEAQARKAGIDWP
ncbi:MAG: DUF5131 family protein [Desulfovibrionaceae bacterium]|nr:DUF5131 family protein [Desulfovibrionaceae bacterium]